MSQLSPILIGALITLLTIFLLMIARLYWRRRHRKAGDQLDSSKQSSSLLCSAAEVNKKQALKTSPRWQYNESKARNTKLETLKSTGGGGSGGVTDATTNSVVGVVAGGGGPDGGIAASGGAGGGGTDSAEDERDPDVIPAQYGEFHCNENVLPKYIPESGIYFLFSFTMRELFSNIVITFQLFAKIHLTQQKI